jgi:hypothetical protein
MIEPRNGLRKVGTEKSPIFLMPVRFPLGLSVFLKKKRWIFQRFSAS